MSGVGTVPSDESIENVTLTAYRDLNKSSGQSILKAEFTKWIMRFAAGTTTGAATTTVPSGTDVTLNSVLEEFGIVTASSKMSALYDDGVGTDPAAAATGNSEGNNCEADGELETRAVETVETVETLMPDSETKSEIMETNATTATASSFDVVYVAEAAVDLTSNEQERTLPDAQRAEHSVERDDSAFVLTPPVNASEEEEHAQSVPTAMQAQDEEGVNLDDSYGLGDAMEITEKQDAADFSASPPPDEPQEYEEEFAPETPRATETAFETVGADGTQAEPPYEDDVAAESSEEVIAAESKMPPLETAAPSAYQDEPPAATGQDGDDTKNTQSVDDALLVVGDSVSHEDPKLPTEELMRHHEDVAPAPLLDLDMDARDEVRSPPWLPLLAIFVLSV